MSSNNNNNNSNGKKQIAKRRDPFDDLFMGFPFQGHRWDLAFGDDNNNQFFPKLDIVESDQSIDLALELPGINKEDIHVELNDDHILTVAGERKFEKKDEGKKYHRVERSYGMFKRQVQLPNYVQSSDISATTKDGVLHVTVKKNVPEKKSSKIAIN